MRILVLVALAWLSGCSWLGLRKAPPPPPPTQIIVTGCPAGSVVLVDDVQVGLAAAQNNQTQVLNVTTGAHTVAIQLNGKIVYREQTAVGAGERRVVLVKSGFGSRQ